MYPTLGAGIEQETRKAGCVLEVLSHRGHRVEARAMTGKRMRCSVTRPSLGVYPRKPCRREVCKLRRTW